MPDIHFVQPCGEILGFEAPDGLTLMQAATGFGVPGILGECGGQALCATCHVYVDPAWAAQLPPAGAAELALLEGTAAERRDHSRLSCQIILTPALQGLVVHLPDCQR